MTAYIGANGVNSFTDDNGKPLTAGKLFTYAAGTSTPQAVYADAAGTAPLPNPLILDSAGRATFFRTGAYKFVLLDQFDYLVDTIDNVADSGEQLTSDLAGSGGSELVGFLQAGAGAVMRTTQAKSRERVTLEDYGGVADGTTDCSQAFKDAHSYLTSVGGGTIELLFGTYRVAAGVVVTSSNIGVIGQGCQASSLQCDLTSMVCLQFGIASTVTAVTGCSYANFAIKRAPGIPPTGSIGVDCQCFNYIVERDVSVENHDILRSVTGNTSGISIGWEAYRPLARSAQTTFALFENVAGCRVWGGELGGSNYGDAYDARSCVAIKGVANDIVMFGTQLIPRGPGTGTLPASVSFFNIAAGSSGVFKFIECNTEAVSVCFDSDVTSTNVTELVVTSGRWTPTTNVFNLATGTQLVACEFNGCGFGQPVIIVDPKWVLFTGCRFSAGMHLVGGTGATCSLADGNVFIGGDLVLDGAWDHLHIGTPQMLNGGVMTNNSATGDLNLFYPDWKSWNPPITATTGTFTAATGAGRWIRRGKLVHVEFKITITTNGSAAGSISAGFATEMPTATNNAVAASIHSTGPSMVAFVDQTNFPRAVSQIKKYDGSYLGGDSSGIYVTVVYEAEGG